MMVSVLKKPKPNLANLECSRMKFEPGDRVLVRTHRNLSRDEMRKLRKTISKWAGCEVEILFVNALEVDLGIDPKNKL